MAYNVKSYTDVEQSKVLAKILPIESADMYYQHVLPKSDKIKHNPEIGNPVNALKWYNKGYTTSRKEPITLYEYCIPCWSTQALLDEIPYQVVNAVEEDLTLHVEKEELQYHLRYENECTGACYEIETETYDDLIDACFEMIVKLKEKDLI